jgi:hypothetical protein
VGFVTISKRVSEEVLIRIQKALGTSKYTSGDLKKVLRTQGFIP